MGALSLFESAIDTASRVLWESAPKYDGKPVTLNKPFRTPGESKKFAVFTMGPDGDVVKVRFGDPDMEIRRDNPDRRRAFRSRHSCDDDKPKKWEPRYWSCKTWEAGTTVSDLLDEDRAMGLMPYTPVSDKDHVGAARMFAFVVGCEPRKTDSPAKVMADAIATMRKRKWSQRQWKYLGDLLKTIHDMGLEFDTRSLGPKLLAHRYFAWASG